MVFVRAAIAILADPERAHRELAEAMPEARQQLAANVAKWEAEEMAELNTRCRVQTGLANRSELHPARALAAQTAAP